MASQPFMSQLVVLAGISIIMTVGVYGLVAGIVKLDDIGLYLTRKPGAGSQQLGRMLVNAAPPLMRFLAVAGTIAMFLVGGGILTHGLPFAHHAIEAATHSVAGVAGIGGLLAAIVPAVLDGLFGIVAGALLLAVVMVIGKLRGSPATH